MSRAGFACRRTLIGKVKSQLELQVADLGPQSLKNIADPVRAYLLRQRPPATQKPSKLSRRPPETSTSLVCAAGSKNIARTSCRGNLRLARRLRAAFLGRFR